MRTAHSPSVQSRDNDGERPNDTEGGKSINNSCTSTLWLRISRPSTFYSENTVKHFLNLKIILQHKCSSMQLNGLQTHILYECMPRTLRKIGSFEPELLHHVSQSERKKENKRERERERERCVKSRTTVISSHVGDSTVV